MARGTQELSVLLRRSKGLKNVCDFQQLCQHFHSATKKSAGHKVKTDIQSCYTLLEIDHDCTDEEVKTAYIDKARQYHPDSALKTSDPDKFSKVKDAYKSILEHRNRKALKEEEENETETIFDIKHTAPQHRQYLEFEGKGFGTPSQRQRQYQQHRMAQVTENIFQHRIQKLAAETEDSLVIKDKQQAKKSVISNAIERIVEDLIQESMKRGDFNNLPGQGRPLQYTAHNPFIDIGTHNLNKILVNNGFAPEWIMLQSEIRKEMKQARESLALANKTLGPGKSEQVQSSKKWQAAVSRFKTQVEEVNAKINKFNLIVPFLNKQQVPYVADDEVKKIVENLDKYLPQEQATEADSWSVTLNHAAPSGNHPSFGWKEVWNEIKSVFRPAQKTVRS